MSFNFFLLDASANNRILGGWEKQKRTEGEVERVQGQMFCVCETQTKRLIKMNRDLSKVCTPHPSIHFSSLRAILFHFHLIFFWKYPPARWRGPRESILVKNFEFFYVGELDNTDYGRFFLNECRMMRGTNGSRPSHSLRWSSGRRKENGKLLSLFGFSSE